MQQLTAKDVPSLHKTRMAEADGQLQRYIRDMGIDGKLFEAAAKIPHEDIYYLSRDEIAAYGIDRRPYSETPWFVAQMANKTMYVSKWIVEARGPDRKDYRVSIVLMSCLQPQRATILYMRALASDEVGRSVTATFSIGKHRAKFAFKGDGKKQNAIDTGALFLSSLATVPFDEIEAAAAHGAIGIVETHARAATDGNGPRAIELQTDGLAEGIKTLRDKCVQPAQPVSNWADGMRTPWGAEKKAPPSFPATPYGAFPAPELGLEKKEEIGRAGYFARSASAVRRTISGGVAAIFLARSSRYSPGAGSNSDCDFLISVRNSGSRVVAWNAVAQRLQPVRRNAGRADQRAAHLGRAGIEGERRLALGRRRRSRPASACPAIPCCARSPPGSAR